LLLLPYNPLFISSKRPIDQNKYNLFDISLLFLYKVEKRKRLGDENPRWSSPSKRQSWSFWTKRSGRLAVPAVASIEDLRAAQKELASARDVGELKEVFRRWRKIGWKNLCKLWLAERTPEQLKNEGG
jgi:hypothetical protein